MSEIRTMILTIKNGTRYGMRFTGPDSVAFQTALANIWTENDYSVRFTNSNRNLRNIEWLFDGDVSEFAYAWQR